MEIHIDYDIPESPHRQLASWIRERIESGEFPPGRRIPSETDLVQMSGVARGTARRAIAVLRDEGLTVTIGGRGTYVRPRDEWPAR
jgi:GntR family transcriptional regulator